MLLLPENAGPRDPVVVSPRRPPGSVRRTSSIDSSRPNGPWKDLVVDARARDVLTDADGKVQVTGEVSLRVGIGGATRLVESIATVPARPELDEMVGTLVGPGFRSKLNALLPVDREQTTLLYLLLDDLPGAALVSGYALQRSGGFGAVETAKSDEPVAAAAPAAAAKQPVPPRRTDMAEAQLRQNDVCAGWAYEGTMMETLRRTGQLPVPAGPAAPALERPDDEWSWHAMAPLPPHGMRRRRRLDLIAPAVPGDPYRLDVHFRDSYADEAQEETVVHEYSVTGTVDGVEGRVIEVTARAQVLPWVECPGALASADRLAGMELAALRDWVRREMKGVSTCTHLNDTLRSLGDVTALLPALRPAA